MATNTSNNIHVFEGEIKFSAFQPIDVKPVFGQKWVTNGKNNENFSRYKDSYNDSPTNQSIINAFVSYINGEGLIDTKENTFVSKYISDEDVLLAVQDYKTYGGCSFQVIWSKGTAPFKIQYIPIYKLAVNVNDNMEVNGYWYSWDWSNKYKFKPEFYPKFTGAKIKEQPLEILYIRRPTAEPFFPIPDYFSALPWCKVEGELANAGVNHFKNALSAMTIINYNNGRIVDDALAKSEAERVRAKAVGIDIQNKVLVSFNEGAEEALIVDQLHPPELNQQNVFYSEEAERKIIVGHSAPPILFSGSNQGSGFSSNADERAISLKELYRRSISPAREVIIRELSKVFKLIDSEINLDFKDFESETQLENNND